MDSLPLIPGYSFENCAIRDPKFKHKLNYSNGCRIVCDKNYIQGQRPTDASSSAYAQELPDEVIYDPALTYGRVKNYPLRQVIPHYVLYAQKCLKFNAFFRESVFNSPSEYHRVRHVNIIYFLEDDTMCVVEPPVDNAGLVQGKLVSRAKIPKNQNGDFYHWKDLNVGIDIAIYGIIYHTVDCDVFTNEFLRSQGIDLGDKEESPADSYIQNRLAKINVNPVASIESKRIRSGLNDSRRRFLEYGGMILTFDALWNDDFYQVMYFLMDDTIMIKEIPYSNNGKDPHRVLLKRMKIPKNWTDISNTFPSIYQECGDEEIMEYYAPIDLIIGQTIFIFGRRFLLYDCDNFTRKYYNDVLNIEQPQKMLLDNLKAPSQRSLGKQNHPKISVEKTDTGTKEIVIRNIFNHPNKLRYMASMIAVHPEDEGRNFILEYNLSDGKLKINEISKRNSGHRAGCFLASMHVPKSKKLTDDDDNNNTDDNIIYYSPEDFFIGAQINIFNHRFVIEGADLFVLRYLQSNSEKFSTTLIDNMTNYFNKKDIIKENISEQINENQNIIKERILPAEPRNISPTIAHMTSNLPHEIICNSDKMTNDKLTSLPRQIRWADQVQVPCNL